MCTREARIDPRWKRALEIGEERTSTAKCTRDGECGTRKIRLNRPAKEIAKTGARHSLRFPLSGELGETAGSQKVRQINFGHLEELIAPNTLQSHPRIRCAGASGEGSVPHLKRMRKGLVAFCGALCRVVEKRDLLDVEPMHVGVPSRCNRPY